MAAPRTSATALKIAGIRVSAVGPPPEKAPLHRPNPHTTIASKYSEY